MFRVTLDFGVSERWPRAMESKRSGHGVGLGVGRIMGHLERGRTG